MDTLVLAMHRTWPGRRECGPLPDRTLESRAACLQASRAVRLADSRIVAHCRRKSGTPVRPTPRPRALRQPTIGAAHGHTGVTLRAELSEKCLQRVDSG